MEIELLFFEGCPNSDVALERVYEATAAERIAASVQMVEILDADHAIAHHFLGSPSIRIDGEDVEMEARVRTDYGFMCRTYPGPDGGIAGAPSVELISSAIKGRLSPKT
jgi:hypothetical protein